MNNLNDILSKSNKGIFLEEEYEFERILFNKRLKRLELYFKNDISIIEEQIKRELSALMPEIAIVLYSKKSTVKQCTNEFIQNLLNQYNESCVACIDIQNIMIDKNSITIHFPYQMAKETFENKGLHSRLKEDLLKECGVEFKLNLLYEQKLSNDDFLEKNEKEELNTVRTVAAAVNRSINKPKKKESSLSYGRKIKGEPQDIQSLTSDSYEAVIKGKIYNVESRETKSKKIIVIFDINDQSGATICKLFLKPEKYEEIKELFTEGNSLKVMGNMQYDSFSNYNCIMVRSIEAASIADRRDLSPDKRIELHAYTQFSASNGFISPKALIKELENWGHEAVGITDQGVVQAFPDIADAVNGKNIRALYGMEMKLLEDYIRIFTKKEEENSFNTFVVFDIETTGLSSRNDRITEIGAVKIIDGKITEVYNQLVNPEKNIPPKIVELTGITNAMVENEPVIDKVLPEFLDFVGDSILVAHNADFDTAFIFENCRRLSISWSRSFIDTLALARALYPELRNHKLNTLTKHLEVKLENHHRASDDAKATANIFLKMIDFLSEKNIKLDENINQLDTEWPKSKNESHNALCYAKNYTGLKNLYKMVSESSLHYFFKTGGVPKSILEKYREGLIIGSGNSNGELYKAILNKETEETVKKIASFYDFLEIQPINQNLSLLKRGKASDRNELIEINKKITGIGEELNIPVAATGDVHYLNSEDFVFRNIILEGQGNRNLEEEGYYYLRTTEEMLKEFDYLGSDKAREVVIDNTHNIAEQIEDLKPIPDGTFPPVIEGSDEELKNLTYTKAYNIYGNPLPELVEKRIDRELTSIISNGYAVLYIIAQKLVKRSNEDGYLVGSRGSVGSSLVAFLADITEVNSLPPHYICSECNHSEFILDGSYGSGVDLPDKICPKCGTLMKRDGFDIPFEVFLGFEGDKEPDIDLNFAGEYQSTAHEYTEEMFGKGKVFRAGTITTIAENTAFGYIKKYFEKREVNLHPAAVRRYQRGIVGVKRSTGQHPGGVMVVPRDKDITDFCPIQHPADDINSDIITTHFNYQSISGRILKLDLLGHDVPTIIKMLSDLTGVDAINIPMDDQETMEVFRSVESLNMKYDASEMEVGTLGIPEFGTGFVRQMLKDTRPTTFSELVRISGLSHGTDVWLNNAQDLIREGKAVLKETICTRDDIMLFLILKGLDNKKAFKIMETVRKGRPLDPETIQYMEEYDLPSWYIDSCKKIQYLFPKAHAVAYNLMSYRIAYFKVHYPEAFYATYFTIKIADYPGNLVAKGIEAIKDEMERIKSLGNDVSPKEKSVYNLLEVIEEMYARGIESKPVSFKHSDKLRFTVPEKGFIQPPFRALEGVSDSHSISIYKEAQNDEFISIQELVKRTKINKVAIEALREHGTLDGLPETNQMSFL